MTAEKATGVSVVVTMILTVITMTFNIFDVPADRYWVSGWPIIEFSMFYLVLFIVVGMPLMIWLDTEEGE